MTKDAFRINMASDAHYNLELHQMDVKIAFRNGDLNEVICMCSLECFSKTGDAHKVYRLKKSIYSLKQACRQWYTKLTSHSLSS